MYIFILNINLFLFCVCFKNVSDTLAQYPSIPTVILRWWKLKFCWLRWSIASFPQRRIRIFSEAWIWHTLQTPWVLGSSCTGANSCSDWKKGIPLCSEVCGSHLWSDVEMECTNCLLQRWNHVRLSFPNPEWCAKLLGVWSWLPVHLYSLDHS